VADSTNKIYYFESALSPNIVWVNLKNVNLGPGSGIRAVAVENNYSIIGNIDDQLAPAKPINYLALTADNAPAVVQPGDKTPAAAPADNKSGFTAWWLLPIVGLLGLLGVLPRMFRKPKVAPSVKVEPVEVGTRAPEAAKVATPPSPPPAPAPTVAPVVERPVEVIHEVTAHETPVVHETHVEHDSGPVVRYEPDTPAETTIAVTYENNALGDHQESRADKSDLTPD
jgi:hypothetical protein